MGRNRKAPKDVKSLAVLKPRPAKLKRNAYLNAKTIVRIMCEQTTEQHTLKSSGLSSKNSKNTESDKAVNKKKSVKSLKKSAQCKKKKQSKKTPKAKSQNEKVPAAKQEKSMPRHKRIASLNAQVRGFYLVISKQYHDVYESEYESSIFY